MAVRKIYLSIGGNVGDTLSIFDDLLQTLDATEGISNVESSRFYQSRPWGFSKQRDFINGVLRLQTSLSIEEFHLKMQEIERAHGKKVLCKYGPRTLDIDILFVDSQVIDNKKIKVPHPLWEKRLFVLLPMLDLTSDITINSKNYDISKLISSFSNEEISGLRCIDRSRRHFHAQ